MGERTRLCLLSFLFLIALGIVIVSIVRTLEAAHNFQHQNNAARAGDVSTVGPWMTIHVISHVYRVPEEYVAQSLHLAPKDPLRRATLSEIATRRHQPVEQVIHTVQQAILTYRQEHAQAGLFMLLLRFQRHVNMPGTGG